MQNVFEAQGESPLQIQRASVGVALNILISASHKSTCSFSNTLEMSPGLAETLATHLLMFSLERNDWRPRSHLPRLPGAC